jgi:hypothetical protein
MCRVAHLDSRQFDVHGLVCLRDAFKVQNPRGVSARLNDLQGWLPNITVARLLSTAFDEKQ